jgi:hypothetical protein
MGQMRKFYEEKDYLQVPNKTALAPESKENPISLQALGLLVNICSYSDRYDLHKTQLYKRFIKNKETSVKGAWAELMETGYILEFKVRVGRNYEYIYYYAIKPYSQDQRERAEREITDEYGVFWTLDFQDLKNRTSKTGPQNQELLKELSTELTKDSINEKLYKPKTKTSTSPSLTEIESTDKILKGIFKEIPFDEIKAQVLADIEIGDLTVTNANQYKGIMTSRINDHLKKVKKANFRPNRSARTELLPDWFDKPKPEPEIEPKEDLEAKKREIAEMLKMIDD